METETSKGKEIRIPGPDHPIAISPAEGKVRLMVAGKIIAESTRALRLEEKGYPPVYYRRVAIRGCRSSFEPGITATVRTRGIVRTAAFRSAVRNRNMPSGLTKNLTTQSQASMTTWLFIPRGSMQSK